MTHKPFIHLRLHTEFSLKDGMLRIDDMMKSLVKHQTPAIALTDFMNLFAVVKFYKEAIGRGIKPIIGCELLYQASKDTPELHSIIVLCQNIDGYRHLTQLVSMAYEKGQINGQPRIYLDWLFECSEGLIVLSGASQGEIGKTLLLDKKDIAKEICKKFHSYFPNRFYLEIQRLGKPDEEKLNEFTIDLANQLNIPLVATNSVCFLEEDDFEAHEARICIHQGRVLADPNRPKSYHKTQYLKNSEEMAELFSDLPQALDNSYEIAKRCSLPLTLGKSYLPNFPTPDSMPVDDYLIMCSTLGLEKRIPFLSGKKEIDEYKQRLENELNVITKMGFSGYFLIVADFIQWAKDNQIPVGPGRGSGAGSLVAYALGITDLDPLEYDLLFERFLNPERVSMPDFDVDFCMIGRDQVIDYVARRYGRESVAQIITFGTMAAKAVVRDVGRVLGYPYNFVDKIAKLIPFEIGMTLETALSQEPELFRRYQDEDDVKELLDLAKKLEGISRNAGKHAGGVVIAPSGLTDFTAVYCEENSTQKVSQFDKDDVEAVGLVKFDFLGLRTLTIIHDAIQIQHKIEPEHLIDIARIPLNDPATFKLLQSGQTTAVFQLESRGMQELIKRLQPDCFEDIVALVALFRPGPLQSGMVDDFIDRKQGRAEIVYLHPDLELILKPTYGVILYQEQVMQIAQVLASYSLGAADLLRRAMGKKKPEEMAQQRTIFLDGASARGVDQGVASQIFDLMEKFAGYGFNKSHSAAYALVSYQTAWLKTHYPASFMAAVLSSDMDNTDKVVHMLKECQRMKLNIHPPHINKSFYSFTVSKQHVIDYGLGAIKGIGESAVELIIKERDANGHYQSIEELCRRLDLRKINKRVLEALIKSGTFDGFHLNRASQLLQLEESMKLGAQNWSNQLVGQQNLFALFEDNPRPTHSVAEWSLQELLAGERETLGWYVSGHPSDEIVHEFSAISTPIKDINHTSKKLVRTVGMISEWRKMITKKGKSLIIVTLSQSDSSMEMILFPDKIPHEMQQFNVGELVLIEGEVSLDAFKQSTRMVIQKVLSYEQARVSYANRVVLKIQEHEQSVFHEFKKIIQVFAGDCPVMISYHTNGFSVDVQLGEQWRIRPDFKCIQMIKSLGLDSKQFAIIY
jgi:DNA polymerase-3 subunit alpha